MHFREYNMLFGIESISTDTIVIEIRVPVVASFRRHGYQSFERNFVEPFKSSKTSYPSPSPS